MAEPAPKRPRAAPSYRFAALPPDVFGQIADAVHLRQGRRALALFLGRLDEDPSSRSQIVNYCAKLSNRFKLQHRPSDLSDAPASLEDTALSLLADFSDVSFKCCDVCGSRRSVLFSAPPCLEGVSKWVEACFACWTRRFGVECTSVHSIECTRLPRISPSALARAAATGCPFCALHAFAPRAAVPQFDPSGASEERVELCRAVGCLVEAEEYTSGFWLSTSEPHQIWTAITSSALRAVAAERPPSRRAAQLSFVEYLWREANAHSDSARYRIGPFVKRWRELLKESDPRPVGGD